MIRIDFFENEKRGDGSPVASELKIQRLLISYCFVTASKPIGVLWP